MDVHFSDVEADQGALDRGSADWQVGGSILALDKDALVYVVLFFVQPVEVSVDREALLNTHRFGIRRRKVRGKLRVLVCLLCLFVDAGGQSVSW